MKCLLPTCIAVVIASTTFAEVRTWTDASGQFKISAELVGVQAGQVTLKRDDGTTVRLPVARLSQSDQALLKGGGATASGGEAVPSGDWPQWRGPNHDDRSTETGLLKKWPKEGPKRLWVHEDGGLGYSGFSVVAGKLYTLGLFDAEEKLICLDIASGKKVWDVTIGPMFTNKWGNGPRSTPSVADGKVYALSASGVIACVDAATGKREWDKSLTKDLGGTVPGWGYTESPLVEGDMVLVTPGGRDGTLAALDAKSGKVKWRSKDWTEGAQYSSCVPIDFNGKRQVVQLVMNSVAGVDAANGSLLWKADFPGRTAVIPTPIFSEGHVYVTAGYGVGCKMVKLGGEKAEEVYANNVMVNHHGSVVLVDGHLYGHSDSGGWVCQDFKTGTEKWKSRDLGKGCVTFADGHLYCVDESTGTVVLVEANPNKWDEKGRFELQAKSEQRSPDGRIWTHPVVVGGRLYLRDQEFISCYDVKG